MRKENFPMIISKIWVYIAKVLFHSPPLPSGFFLGRRFVGRCFLGRRFLGRRFLGRCFLGRRFLGRRFLGRRSSFSRSSFSRHPRTDISQKTVVGCP